MSRHVVVLLAVLTLSVPSLADLQNVQVGGSIQIWGGWYSPYYEIDDAGPHLPVGIPKRPIGGDGFFSSVRADGRGHSLAFAEQRTTLSVSASFTDNVSAFVQLESIDTWGEDFRSNWVTGIDSRADSSDDIEFYQAYIEATEVFGTPLRLRIGRQEMTYGSGWLVGNNYYPDPFTMLSFDAVRATWSTDKFDIDAWWSKLNERGTAEEDGDVDFYGVYGTYRFNEDTSIDLYWMWVRDAEARKDTNGTRYDEFIEDLLGFDDYDVTNLHTLGIRTAGALGGLDWELEGAYQFGNASALGATFLPEGWPYGDDDAKWSNWAGHTEIGYTFEDVKWQPRPYIGGHYYSGEDNRSLSFWNWLNPFHKPEASVSFNRLFSDYEFDYFLDGSALSNFWFVDVGVDLTFSEALSVRLDLAKIQAVEGFAWPAAIRCGRWQFPLAPELGFWDDEGSKDLGWQVTASGTYEVTENLSLEAAYVHYFVGDAIKDGVFADGNGTLLLGGYDDEDADFFYTMVTLSF